MMEGSKRRFILAFGSVVCLTAFFLLTTVYELPRSILHRVLPGNFVNFSTIDVTKVKGDEWWFPKRNSTVNSQSKLKSGSPTKPSREVLVLVTTQKEKLSSAVVSTSSPGRKPWKFRVPVKWKMKDNYMSGTAVARWTNNKFYLSASGKGIEKARIKSITTGQGYSNGSKNLTMSTNAQITANTNRNILDWNDVSSVSQPPKRVPDAIIIGVKKGGTRALLQFLCIHPRINCASKEIHFFDKNYGKGLDWYIEQMPAAYSNETVMEKTPAYFVTKSVPERIFKANPLVKLIITFRDPTRRCISDYAQGLDNIKKRKRKFKVKTFESKVFLDVNKTIINTKSPIICNSVYVEHLQRWLSFFPRHQLHYVSGEILVEKPWEELYEVQKFLNLPIFITKNNFRMNKTKGFYCLKWKEDRNRKRKNAQCLGDSKGRKHPNITKSTINALQAYFMSFNKMLYNVTGRDFGWP